MAIYDPVGFRVELWLTVLIVLASIGIIITFGLWTYTVYKILTLNIRTKNLWLSQASLFFITLSYGTCFIFIPMPNYSTCASIRFLPGFCYAGLFATLLLKTLNIIQESRNVYIPVSFQLLLFSTLLILQSVIGAEWLILVPPGIASTGKPAGLIACSASLQDIVLSYICQIGILFILCVATSVARHKTVVHREEAFLISVCIGFIVAVWICWILLGTVGIRRPHYEDPCLAFGLLATATAALILIFLPRARRLSKLSRTLKHSAYIDEYSVPSRLYTINTNPSLQSVTYGEKLSRKSLHHSTTSLHSLSQFSPSDAFLSMQNKKSNLLHFSSSGSVISNTPRPNSRLVYFSPGTRRSFTKPVHLSRENIWVDDGTHL